MPDITGASRWEPNHPWIDVHFSDGSVRPVEDPSGQIEREVNGIAQRLGATMPPVPDQRLAQVSAVPTLPLTPPTTFPTSAPMADAGTRVLDAVAPGMPGSARAAEVQARADARSPQPSPQPVMTNPDLLPQRPTEPEPPSRAERVIDNMGFGGLITVRKTSGRFQPSTRSAQGPSQESLGAVREASDAALDLRGQSIRDMGEAERLSATRDAITGAVMRDQGKADAERLTGQNAELVRRRSAVAQKLQSTAALKENPSRAWSRLSGWQIALAVLGAAGGGLKTAVLGGENATLQALSEMVDQDIAGQRNDKNSMLAEYTRQLGDQDAAILALKSDMRDALAKQAEGNARVTKSADRLSHLKSIQEGLVADALDARAQLEQRMMGVESSSEKYVPGGISVVNPTLLQLKALGIDEKEWAKFTTEKAGDLPGAGSILNGVRTLDERMATIQAIAEAHGGTIPGTGVIDFNRSDRLRELGARLGFKGQVNATEVKQIANQQLLEAQSLIRGVPSDRDQAIINDVVGTGTTESFKRGINYFRGQANAQLRARAQVFPGREQAVIDMLQGRMRATSGAPPAGRTPF